MATNKLGIVYGDFVGELSIDFGSSSQQTKLDRYLDEYERLYLEKLLGYKLYKEFYTALSGEDPATKWTQLRDGAEYTVNYNGDYTVKFDGVKKMVKYFVYFHYLRDQYAQGSQLGIITPLNENSNTSQLFISSKKLSEMFNKGVDIYGMRDRFRSKPLPDFQSRIEEDLVHSNNYLFGSAYNFISQKNDDTPDTYPDWVFNDLDKINALGF